MFLNNSQHNHSLKTSMSNNGKSGLRLFNIESNAEAIVHLKDVIMHHNSDDGVKAYGEGTVNIHGDKTAIHSNENYGICAFNSAKVLIHLSSHHNTSYNNEGIDRNTSWTGGTITNVED